MTAKKVFLAATGQNRGKTTTSLGLLAAIRDRGLRLGFVKPVGQRYLVVDGTRADEDAVISRIRAPLTGVTRVDMVTGIDVGGVAKGDVRAEDVPFDAASGEVIFIPPPAALKKMPAHTIRVKLLAVEGAGERVIGDYTFAHTAS